MKSDSGVSELIGAILLVSLVVMLMMVVTTVLISQPHPEKIPELSVSISVNGTGSNGTAPYDVYFTHMGGDALQGGEYLVVIDGTEVSQDLYREPPLPLNNTKRKELWAFTNSSTSSTFVIYNRPNSPKTVEIYYNGPSNKVLLAKTNFI
jgi:FlaG/FlaF family flagellin (archaellin)